VSYDGTLVPSGVKFYVDGTLQSNVTVTNTLSATQSFANNTAVLDIGMAGAQGGWFSAGVTPWFNGALDDVRVYNRVLSPQEVTRIYHLGATTVVDATIKTNPNLTNGEVAHWTFDGKDMLNNIADVSGNGNKGTLNAGISTTTIIGRIGQAWSVTSGSGNINVNDSSSMPTTAMSVSFWIKWTGSLSGSGWPNFGQIFLKGAGSNSWEIQNNGTTDGGLYMSINTGGGNANASGQIPNPLDGSWHHIVFTAGSGKARGYKDGVAASNGTYTNGTFSDATALIIANAVAGDVLDDVRVYNRVLSDAEIQRLYGLGK
jgi:hypothetical protein